MFVWSRDPARRADIQGEILVDRLVLISRAHLDRATGQPNGAHRRVCRRLLPREHPDHIARAACCKMGRCAELSLGDYAGAV
ncbi:MAG: hypothetical protein R3E83_20990 [Burkholderiaceae bacterium]